MANLRFRRHGQDDSYDFTGTVTTLAPSGHTRVAHIAVAQSVPAWPGVEVRVGSDRWQVVHVIERNDLGERELICAEIAA